MKPFSDACEENKLPILEVLKIEFANCRNILEIGSGTGQHAVFFASHLPYLTWQTSDLETLHPGINAWREEADLANLNQPISLDVTGPNWPESVYDGVFSANTAHIMSWLAVEKMFEGTGKILPNGGCLCLYGPFNYNGRYTSDSNARFDQWLKNRDPLSGLRDFDKLDALASRNGMEFSRDYEMPVNNRTLVWRKNDR